VRVEVERALLVVAGAGTALVLTGGNLYLAHAIARVRRWRRMLGAVWLVVLVSSGGLVVPLVAAGLTGRTLPQLLGDTGGGPGGGPFWQRWRTRSPPPAACWRRPLPRASGQLRIGARGGSWTSCCVSGTQRGSSWRSCASRRSCGRRVLAAS